VVEVKIVIASAIDASAIVPIPNFQFDCRWDHPARRWLQCPAVTCPCVVHNFKSILEHRSALRLFLPAFSKGERSVKDPDSLFDLFVNSNRLEFRFIDVVTFGSFFEKPVLGA